MMRNWKWEIDKNTFDVINLDFFVNYRFTTLLNYVSVYLFAFLTIAFIASDIYTAIKLIVFNTWSSDVQPFISYTICRWLFFACIALSVVFYLYSIFKSVVAYNTRNVSLTYIDPGASFMYSIRSYKYFCVYNEISSDNFFNYLAFFTYFTLHNCLILLLCDTPRQVINGITIFKILKFNNSMIAVIREIATTNRTEAVILSFMTFSFVIWFIFFVKFLFACLLFWPIYYKIKYEYRYEHGLKQYCCVKINHCVQNFMKVKHAKSLDRVKRENENSNINPKLPDISFDTSDVTVSDDSFGDAEKKKAYELSSFKFASSRTNSAATTVLGSGDSRNPFADPLANQLANPAPIAQRQESSHTITSLTSSQNNNPFTAAGKPQVDPSRPKGYAFAYQQPYPPRPRFPRTTTTTASSSTSLSSSAIKDTSVQEVYTLKTANSSQVSLSIPPRPHHAMVDEDPGSRSNVLDELGIPSRQTTTVAMTEFDTGPVEEFEGLRKFQLGGYSGHERRRPPSF